jgi:hypothetical protein
MAFFLDFRVGNNNRINDVVLMKCSESNAVLVDVHSNHRP